MPFDGNGNFELTQDFQADRDAGPPDSLISADKVMDVLKDIANGLVACLTRDGQNSPSKNISWANWRLTNLGDAVGSQDAANARSVAEGLISYCGLCGGTNAAMTISNTFLDAVAVGTVLRATAIFDNAANPTLLVAGVTAPIVGKSGTAIAPKRIKAGQSFAVQYDGTNYVLIETGNDVFDTSVAALNALSALVPAADKIGYFNSSTGAALADLTAYARTLLAAADAPTAAGLIGFFPTGTTMSFFQTAAPTGWTKSTTHNDKIPRIVSGPAGSGGSTAFSTVFGARTIARANLPNIQLGGSTSEDGSHNHPYTRYGNIGVAGGGGAVGSLWQGTTTANTGADGAHSHNVTTDSLNGGVIQTTIDFAVQYVDMIIASKN